MAQTFHSFAPRWDHPQLTQDELRKASSFEWWYFDLASEDGVSLVLVLSRRNPVLSRRGASIYLELRTPEQNLRRVCNYAADAFRFMQTTQGVDLRVERHSLRMLHDENNTLRYILDLDLPEVRANLEFEPMHAGFLPADDGCYFRARSDPRRRTCVSFSAPLMRARGTLTTRASQRAISGRGYHDHPWGTQQIFYTHRHWQWARLSGTELGAMFAIVQPARGYEGELRFFYSGLFGSFEPQIDDRVTLQSTEWKRDAFWGIRFPHQVEVGAQNRHWTLACTGSLLDTAIYNRSQVRWTTTSTNAPAASDSGAEQSASGGVSSDGAGWVEYYAMPSWLRTLAFIGARIAAFFWRPFPFFGR